MVPVLCRSSNNHMPPSDSSNVLYKTRRVIDTACGTSTLCRGYQIANKPAASQLILFARLRLYGIAVIAMIPSALRLKLEEFVDYNTSSDNSVLLSSNFSVCGLANSADKTFHWCRVLPNHKQRFPAFFIKLLEQKQWLLVET